MATIYRALATAVLALYAYVVFSGVGAGDGPETLAAHLRAGLLASVAGALVNSLPFAYFIGTRFWVKAFVRASRAPDSWNGRHDQWMKGRAYPFMYFAAFAPALMAITGGLGETGRIAGWWHPSVVTLGLACQLVALRLTPRAMSRNSALMDQLADEHQVPKPGTPQMEELLEEEERVALPPLFQLSRVLMLLSANAVILWLYLRFGTEGWRNAPLLPFAIPAAVLLTLGLGLNQRHDPNHPEPPARAWARAIAWGAALTATCVWLATTVI